eukprot:sb/3466124/
MSISSGGAAMLFKSYLNEPLLLSKTASPEPQIRKFRDQVSDAQNSALADSVSSLCSMVQEMHVSMRVTNELVNKLFAPNSEYVVLQKSKLEEMMREVREDIKSVRGNNDLQHLSQQSMIVPHQQSMMVPHQSQQSMIVPPKLTHSQEEARPLTPPCSFEALLKQQQDQQPRKPQSPVRNNSQSNHADIFNTVSRPQQRSNAACFSVKKEKNRKKAVRSSSQTSPKFPTTRRTSPRLTKARRTSPRLSARVSPRFANTKKWLESIPSPVKSPEGGTTIKRFLASRGMKRQNSCDSDNESIGKWSCSTMKTFKSTRKKGRGRRGNFVVVTKATKSDMAWDAYKDDHFFERVCRSEY